MKSLTRLERDILEITLTTNIKDDLRNKTMLLVALYTGARASELLALTWESFDLVAGAVIVSTLKSYKRRKTDTDISYERNRLRAANRMSRAIAFPKVVKDALISLKALSPSRPFDICYSRLAAIWAFYRPVVKPFHCLRHTFTMRVYDTTNDIVFTQKSLGHASIANTMIYVEKNYTAQDFRKKMRIR